MNKGMSYGYNWNFYGSAWHLLRFLGYHREYFTGRVCSAAGIDAVRWLDYSFQGRSGGDGRISGVDFLNGANSHEQKALTAWEESWPSHAAACHWDAVGRAVARDRTREWILVEASASVDDLRSSCPMQGPGSIQRLSDTISRTAGDLGEGRIDPWISEYYRFAVSLAILDCLTRSGVNARLLQIFFCGDSRPDAHFCPPDRRSWKPAIMRRYRRLGIGEGTGGILERVHRIFINVNGR
ncbi:MAG: hypothetical protein R6U39_11580 [Candidatus Aegiribacteria sp.]